MGYLNRILPHGVRRIIKRWVLRSRYRVQIGPGSDVSLDTVFEGDNRIYRDCVVSESYFGRGSYVAAGSVVHSTRIGRFTSVGSGVKISLGRHPVQGFVSTHPAFFSTQAQAGFTFVQEPMFEDHVKVTGSEYCVEIGHDVWIGDNATIMDGVQIGNGAVVGAGAIVTRSVEPYSINLGVPARTTRYRFAPEVIDFLMKLGWWERDKDWLSEHAEFFCNVDLLMRRIHTES